MGKVQVTIIEATGLKKSDPYCQIHIEKEKKKTKIIKDTENPTWKGLLKKKKKINKFKETINLSTTNNSKTLLYENNFN